MTAEWKTRDRENSREKVALVMEKFFQTTASQSGMVCDGRPQQDIQVTASYQLGQWWFNYCT